MVQLHIIFKFYKIQDRDTAREQKNEGNSKGKFFFIFIVANKATAKLPSKTFTTKKTKIPLSY